MISTGICRWLFLLISLSTWTRLIDSKEMRVVCYYTNWSVYRPGQAKFSPQNINPYLCTHLIYAFGGFTKENTLKPFDKYQDIEKGGYAKFTGLKTYNKNLKTMIAIGGWNEGSSRFSPMVASSERRKELVKNTIKFLRQNHFDGLDLDWEYPTFRDGGKPRDRDNYAHLVQELREEFERESEKTGRPRLLLTMAVPAGIEYINKGYDVPKLTKYLDWMNILSYDYHSAFEPAVNHHAPLFSLEEDNEYNYDAELNIDYTIKHYMKLGAEPNKLVLGIPTYGRSYTLFNPDAYEIGSPADGPGDMGEATRENGYLAYYEICENVKSQDWEVDEPNPDAMGPIAFKDNQWVGYDDENIVRKKAEYVAENSLGGIMFWAIDNDDFRGNCHGKPYPLIEAGKEALLNAYGLTEDNLISPPSKPTKASKFKSRTRTSKTSTTEKPEEISVSVSPTRRRRIKSKSRDEENNSAQSAKRRKDSSRKSEGTSTYSSLKVITPAYTTPAPPATPDMGGAFKCEDEGFYPHPKDCKKYFWCLGGPGDSGIVAHQFTCPAGLFFNKAADSCDYSQNVLCNKKLQKATSTTTQKSEPSTTESTTSQKPTPSSIFSTSRIPPKITSAISKSTFNFRTTTTTTTTEAYEDEDEYEDDEEEPDKKEESEEDPRVIKELIDLIKKAGGIEELEKQLKFGKEGSASTSTSDVTTPSGISKSLYERVLSKTSKNSLSALKKPSFNRNSGGPQGNGAEESKEKKIDKGRPQYRTLTRQRPSTEKSTDTKAEEEEKEEPKQKTSFRTKSTLEYVNIRRPKTSSTTESNDDDGFSRNKILGELDDETDDDEDEEENSDDIDDVRKKYVNIRRPRPSTTEASATSSKYQSIRRSTVSPVEAEEDQEEKKYKTIRRGSTTESSPTSEEPTSLRYQTIRRGTTTTPISIPEEDDNAVRRRSTTASTTTTTTEDSSESKYLPIRRSTTAAPVEEQNESSAKYQTVKRDSTTQPTIPTSERASSTESAEKEATENITENDLAGTTLPQESISNINTITTENLISSTHKETTESNTDAPSSTSSTTLAGSLSETTEPETKQKRPVLFQPRPFSVGTSSTAKSTTPEPTTTVTSKISTTRPPFRVGYRKRSTTTSRPTGSGTLPDTSAPSPRVTKPSRRKALPSRTTTTGKPVESQATGTTQSPTRFTNRFKFVSRKPFLKTSTKRPISNTTDQTLESTNHQTMEDNSTVSTEATAVTDLAPALQKAQQAPIPQAKPSRKRPQILRISAQYSSRTTTRRPSTTTEAPVQTTNIPVRSFTSSSTPPKYTNKKTIAITAPFLRGTYGASQVGVYSTPQSLTADKFVPNIATAAPVVKEIYSSPQTITAQDFISKYTPSGQISTRAKVRYSTTDIPLVIITPGQTATTRRRKPPQAFNKVSSRAEHTYRSQDDYDYYDNIEASILGKIPEHSKVLLHSNGIIECLDQGNFPHPVSCKKFISCAKMDNDKIIGWEYTCPKNLSFDPIGGMCNWSAGLGCNEA